MEDRVLFSAPLTMVHVVSPTLPHTLFLKSHTLLPSEPPLVSERKIAWRFIATGNDLSVSVNEALVRRGADVSKERVSEGPLSSSHTPVSSFLAFQDIPS